MEDCNKSYESMDVDMSGNSVTQMDISHNDSKAEISIKKEKIDEIPDADKTDFISSEIKTEPEPEDSLQIEFSKPLSRFHITKPQSKVKDTHSQIKIISFVLVLVLSIIVYHFLNVKCSELDLKEIETSLSNQVFGQSKAINSIMNALSLEGTKLLLFYGGTGVGKTYTVSIIMESFKHSSNLYHYTMPSFEENFSTDIMYGLLVCHSSMFIVDGLSIEDKHVNEHLKGLIKKGQEQQKNLIVILIYSCDNVDNNYIKKCDDNFETKMTEEFKDAQITFVKFDKLNNMNLRQCIEREAKNQNIKNINYEKLIKKFNVATDGCKGVHMKIKLL